MLDWQIILSKSTKIITQMNAKSAATRISQRSQKWEENQNARFANQSLTLVSSWYVTQKRVEMKTQIVFHVDIARCRSQVCQSYVDTKKRQIIRTATSQKHLMTTLTTIRRVGKKFWNVSIASCRLRPLRNFESTLRRHIRFVSNHF